MPRKDDSFAYVLVRDGTIYFVCTLILNALHLVFMLRSIATTPTKDTSYITTFTEPLTAILMSRFMLNLQAVDYSSRGGNWQSQLGTLNDISVRVPATQSLVFDREIGSPSSRLSAVSNERRAEVGASDAECLGIGERPEERAPAGVVMLAEI
ncbi:hypothetical protein C8Q76DRAFT_83311 [Earliella scabrosa]|nr:hypothetical protein C8Q76DRAFT_83311 [Earliella scabrosa]